MAAFVTGAVPIQRETKLKIQLIYSGTSDNNFQPTPEQPLSRVTGVSQDLHSLALADKQSEAQFNHLIHRKQPVRQPTFSFHDFESDEQTVIEIHQQSQRKKSDHTATMSSEKAGNAKDKFEAQIKSADMSEEMQQESIDVAQEAMLKFSIEKDIAMHIKKTFDERKGPTWHCIVGRNFGSFVTHETKHFIYFYLGHCAILLFKTQ